MCTTFLLIYLEAFKDFILRFLYFWVGSSKFKSLILLFQLLSFFVSLVTIKFLRIFYPYFSEMHGLKFSSNKGFLRYPCEYQFAITFCAKNRFPLLLRILQKWGVYWNLPWLNSLGFLRINHTHFLSNAISIINFLDF